jgi:hypothetical protein
MKRLTVKDLRAALEGVPDELEVRFSSDTEEAYEIVLEMARRVKYELPNGQRFADTGETGVDFFEIYGNAYDEEDDDETS